MAPRDLSGSEDDADGDKDESFTSNPKVLKAALELVKRKKAEAIANDEYDVAARLHQRLQTLEAEVAAAAGGGGLPGEDLPGSGAPAGSAASGTSRSWLSMPNPFRTVGLLQENGYSGMQAYGLLGVLYIGVLVIEVMLFYVGYKIWSGNGDGGLGGGGDGDAEEIFYDENYEF
mmetsp:Transcript_109109/g.235087  ORF Transcript_109109/g.235087 Transcript_109109/m.235087 type:complete len:174 (+) Transcript_109109:46-567(+)